MLQGADETARNPNSEVMTAQPAQSFHGIIYQSILKPRAVLHHEQYLGSVSVAQMALPASQSHGVGQGILVTVNQS